MNEEDLVGIVRYAYNVRSVPKLGVLIPKESKKDCHVSYEVFRRGSEKRCEGKNFVSV